MGSVKDLALKFGCSRKTAVSGLYYLSKLGLIRKTPNGFTRVVDFSDLEVMRCGRWYASIVGSTVIVAKVLNRRIRSYTVPMSIVKMVAEGRDDPRLSRKLISRARRAHGIISGSMCRSGSSGE